jgi:hypothetical protein
MRVLVLFGHVGGVDPPRVGALPVNIGIRMRIGFADRETGALTYTTVERKSGSMFRDTLETQP